MPDARSPLIAVCGASDASAEEAEDAYTVGRLLAQRGCMVVCGGLGGVMEAVARGCADAGGTSIGLLPGEAATGANQHLSIVLATGLGELRNALICRVSLGMITMGGGWGTLSEIGFAMRIGRPVVGLRSWEVRRPGQSQPDPGIHRVQTPEAAVGWLLNQLGLG